MSLEEALAHEYYRHRVYGGTTLQPGNRNDEFRASYMAALNSPGLSRQDRVNLLQDAMLRACDDGIVIKPNNFMKEVFNGKTTN